MSFARRPTRLRPRRARRGFSLLEIILALAILTGAVAVIGELVRLGLRNAQLARDITQAQLLCESKLAEITSGMQPPMVVDGVPCEFAPDWLYSVQVYPLEIEGLLGVEVLVYRPEANQSNARFHLVRWMQDPMYELVPVAQTTSPTAPVAAR